MCVVNKQFVFESFYVDLQYDETSLTFTAGSMSLCCVCGHVRSVCEVVVVAYVVGAGGFSGDCDACTVVCVACVYAARIFVC